MTTKAEKKRKRRAGKNASNRQQHSKEPAAPTSHGLQQDTPDEPLLGNRHPAGAASAPGSGEAAESIGEGSSMAATGDGLRRKGKKRQRQAGDASSTPSVATATSGLQHPSLPPSPLVASAASSAKVTADVEGSPGGQHKMNKKKRKKKKRKRENASTVVQEGANAVADGDDTTSVLPNQHPLCGKTTKLKRNSVAQTATSSALSSVGATSTEQSGGKALGRHSRGTNAAAASRGVRGVAAGEKEAGGGSKLSALQQRMRQKLEGAQFRMINETLYTSESKVALEKFSKEPELFDVYHRGFREQVEKWPVHPLDLIIDWLGKYPKARVADFGCGEARLAATVPNKVYSFDLVSPNPRVTACDMAHVPIKDRSVHVAVFCLSLMGTNLADFLREAHRVLVPGGLVKVAEVRSRFEGEEGGVERFLEVAKRLGFDSRQVDRSNTMFLMAEFKKSGREPEDGVEFEAKACVYKRR